MQKIILLALLATQVVGMSIVGRANALDQPGRQHCKERGALEQANLRLPPCRPKETSDQTNSQVIPKPSVASPGPSATPSMLSVKLREDASTEDMVKSDNSNREQPVRKPPPMEGEEQHKRCGLDWVGPACYQHAPKPGNQGKAGRRLKA